ncbi:serine protease, partial [Bacillus haynesii]|nr:serine protease [Bacillus haynesii]
MEYNREDQLETKNELIVSDQKPDQAIKKAEQQKRRLSWMTPILSGIIGGSLVLGVTTYQHSKDETANASVQTQTNETTNSAASSNNANTEKLSSTNSSDISTMV